MYVKGEKMVDTFSTRKKSLLLSVILFNSFSRLHYTHANSWGVNGLTATTVCIAFLIRFRKAQLQKKTCLHTNTNRGKRERHTIIYK